MKAFRLILVLSVLFGAGLLANPASGQEQQKKFYLNEDGTVEARFAAVERKVDNLDQRVTALEQKSTGTARPAAPTFPVNPDWKPGKNVQVGGNWYTYQPDGSLKWCVECNGRPAPTAHGNCGHFNCPSNGGTGPCPCGPNCPCVNVSPSAGRPVARMVSTTTYAAPVVRVSQPVKTSFTGHTHTCSRGHTWDHTMDGGTHRCPYCGEFNNSVSGGAGFTSSSGFVRYSLGAGSGGCASGNCSSASGGGFFRRLFRR